MTAKRRRSTSSPLLLSLAVLSTLSSRPSTRPSVGVHAFTTAPRTLRTVTSPSSLRHPATRAPSRRTTERLLSKRNDSMFDLARRFERADKTELRNDATLVACYVLARFLVYDIVSGTKVEPGYDIQDFVWLSGTFASATVLVAYYSIAGLLSRTYEAERTPIANVGPDSVLRAVVNVVLCTPPWLATEHLLQYGPADIGGPTLRTAVASGFLGFGLFMALAKSITAGMR